MNKASVLLLTILLVSTLVAVFPQKIVAQENPYEDELINLYKRVYQLGREGINVTSIVDELNLVIKYLDEGDLDSATTLIQKIDVELSELERNSGDILFWMNFNKYSVAAALISIPIITYFLLPRIYLMTWYRLRRRWIVKR